MSAPALPQDDARFRLAMESAGIGMAIVSPDGRFMDVNPALCGMLGRPAGALVGQPAEAFAAPDDAARGRELLARLRGGAGPAAAEIRYLRADGTVVHAWVDGAPMPAAGTPACLVWQVHDVSGPGAAERELRERNAELERQLAERTAALEAANRRLESLVHGVSHDLRAPLRAIDGFARQLERGAAPDEARSRHVERIRQAAARMGGLIDGLLELARAGRAALRPADVDLSLLAEWVAAELQDARPEPPLLLDVQPGLAMVGDEPLLKGLLVQLLRNARQFARPGEPARVEVTGERDGGIIRVRVRDHGIGFDMAYADKLFEPFQRLHGGDQGAGDGLGLAIAQQAAARHGGHLRAESEPGAGSTFHLELHDLPRGEAA